MCVLRPCRSTAFIMPTVNCLVELTDMPFTVVSLNDIEVGMAFSVTSEMMSTLSEG